MNWNQTGMPAALVSRLGQRREIGEFKSVLSDAQNHVMQPVDVESMALELAESGGREFVEMVRNLTAALENAKIELENANRRYERLLADLARRGISVTENGGDPPNERPSAAAKSSEAGQAEWEEWDRRFKALLDPVSLPH